jgi:hypothetical protein
VFQMGNVSFSTVFLLKLILHPQTRRLGWPFNASRIRIRWKMLA